jgi:hypothetical protein
MAHTDHTECIPCTQGSSSLPYSRTWSQTVPSDTGSQDRKGGGAGVGGTKTRKMQLHYRAMLRAQQLLDNLIHKGTFVTLKNLTCRYL